MAIQDNPQQRELDREDEQIQRDWIENENRLGREHELAVLKLKGETEAQKYKYKVQLNSRYKKTIIRSILVLRLFNRKIPDSFVKALND